MTPQEKKFVENITQKINNYSIPTNLKEVFAHSKNTFTNVKYNNDINELVDTGIEYFLCSKSPAYFIDKYCYISVPNMGVIGFSLYYFQKKIMEEIFNYRKYVLLKCRQSGLSTVTAFYCLWRCLFRQSESIAVVSKTQDASQDFISKVKVSLDLLPDFISLPRISENTTRLVFSNHSELKAEARSANAGRSATLSLLVLDEAAFYGSDTLVRQIVASAQPALTRTGGGIIIISCYTKDTWINTENGLEKIEDYIPENCKLGYNEIDEFEIDGIEHNQKTNSFYDSGITPIKEIIFKNKTILKVSNIHPLYILGEDGFPFWKQAKDIKIGDKALFSLREKTFGDNDYIGFDWLTESKNKWKVKYKLENFDGFVTEDMSYFFGLLIGDGYFNEERQYAIITNTDKEVTDFLLNNKHFKDFYIEDRNGVDECHYRVQGRYLIKLLQCLGFEKKLAREKTIPKRLFSMSRKNIKALLQGLFDSDGHSRKNRGNVGFTSTSQELIIQIKMLLSMFGIYVGQEHWHTTLPTKIVKVESLCGQIELSDYFSKIFYEKIGFRIKRKQAAYSYVKNNKGTISYPNLNITLKNSYSDIDIANTYSRTIRKGWKRPSSFSNSENASPKSIKMYINYFDGILNGNEIYEKAKDFYEKEWYPVDIIDIKDGEEHTYDFVIPETRSLYANSIVGSNTPNGTASSGAYYFEQVNQLRLSGNNRDEKLVEIDWFEVPDFEHIFPKKGYNDVLYKYIKKDYFNDFEIKKEIRTFFKPIEINWKENSWLKTQHDTLGDAQFRQEVFHDFITMGSSVFSSEIMERVNIATKEPIMMDRMPGANIRGLWIWKLPQPKHRYILGCLPKGEKVLTKNGLKNIEEIDFEDGLINKDGNAINIINKQITKNFNDYIYDIKIEGILRKNKFTGNHPIYSSINTKMKRENFGKKKRFWLFDFKFNKAEDLKVDDWLVYPNMYRNNTLTEDEILSKWPKNITRRDFEIKNPLLDEEFWWFVGIWLAEGWTQSKLYSKTIHTAHNFKTEKIYIERIVNLFKKYDRTVGTRIREERNSIETHFNSVQLYIFLNESFGKYAKNKKVPEWIKYLPENLKIKFIEGYLNGDGSVFKQKINNYTIAFVSVSFELLEGIQDMLYSIGVASCLNTLREAGTMYFPNRTKISVTQKTYQLRINHTYSLEFLKKINYSVEFEKKIDRRLNHTYFSKDLSLIYFKIQNIEKKLYCGTVYNFETDDHTFLCKNIITHNCDVSKGSGRDSSSIEVMDVENYEQVAEYDAHVSTPEFSRLVKKIARFYNQGYVVIESNGIGESVFNGVYMDNSDPYTNVYKQKINRNGITVMTGWITDGKTRQIITNKLIDYINVDELWETLKLYSSRVYAQLSTWIWSNGRADHSENSYDDCLIALALSIHLRDKAVNSGQSFMVDELGRLIDYSVDDPMTAKTGANNEWDFITSEEESAQEKIEKQIGMSFENYKWLIGD